MLKFKNITTKEDIKNYIDFSQIKIAKIDSDNKLYRKWRISDRFDNEYIVTFPNRVGEFILEYISHDKYQQAFILYLFMTGNIIEIHKAVENNKTLQTDKFLKKYRELATFINSLVEYGFIKL